MNFFKRISKRTKIIIVVIVTIFIMVAAIVISSFFSNNTQPIRENNVSVIDGIPTIDLSLFSNKNIIDYLEPAQYQVARSGKLTNGTEMYIISSITIEDSFFLPFRFKYPAITRTIRNQIVPIVVFYNPAKNEFSLPEFLISNLYEVSFNNEVRWVYLLNGAWFVSEENFLDFKQVTITTDQPITEFLFHSEKKEMVGVSISSLGLFKEPRLIRISYESIFSESPAWKPAGEIIFPSLIEEVLKLDVEAANKLAEVDITEAGDGAYPIFNIQLTKNYIIVQSQYITENIWIKEYNQTGTGNITLLKSVQKETVGSSFHTCIFLDDKCYLFSLEDNSLLEISLQNEIKYTKIPVNLKGLELKKDIVQRILDIQFYKKEKVIDLRTEIQEIGLWYGGDWITLINII